MRRQMNWSGICHFKAGDDKVIAMRRGFESRGGGLQRGCVTGEAAEVSSHGCLSQVVWKP